MNAESSIGQQRIVFLSLNKQQNIFVEVKRKIFSLHSRIFLLLENAFEEIEFILLKAFEVFH